MDDTPPPAVAQPEPTPAPTPQVNNPPPAVTPTDGGSRHEVDDASMQQLQSLPNNQLSLNNAKAMLYDRQTLGGVAPQTLLASKSKVDPQEFRDGTAAVAGMSALLGLPAATVAEKFGQYQNQIEGAMGWDHAPNVGAFANNLAGHFKNQDAQETAVKDLQAIALQDAVTSAGKQMSPNPITAFQTWQSAHEDAMKSLPEADRLKVFQNVYLSTQKAFNTPEGALAKQIVDTFGNAPDQTQQDIKGALSETAKRDPILNALGVTSRDGMKPDAEVDNEKAAPIIDKLLSISDPAERQKVYQLAGILEQAKNPQHSGILPSLYSMGQALSRSMDTDYGATAQTIQDQSAGNTADLAKVRMGMELKQASKNTVNPLLYSDQSAASGLPQLATKAGQGFAASAPYLAVSAADPVAGVLYMGANAAIEKQQELLVKNPSMTPNEAMAYGTAASLPSTVLQAGAMNGLTGVFPALDKMLSGVAEKGFKAYLVRAGSNITAFTGANASSVLADSAIHAINPEWNKDSDVGRDLHQVFLNAPQDFVMGAIFAAFHAGKPVDQDKLVSLSQDPTNLIKQGIPQDQAERIASMPPKEIPQALADAMKSVTLEQKQDGIALSIKQAQDAKDAVNDPTSPKLVSNDSGHTLIIHDEKGGISSQVPFSTEEGAQSAFKMAMEHHLSQGELNFDAADHGESTKEDQPVNSQGEEVVASFEKPDLKTIHRAGDSDESGVKSFSSWSEDKVTAKAYLDNPGFGGKTLREEKYPLTNVIDADTTDRSGMEALAQRLGFPKGTGDEWFDNGWKYPWEESKEVKNALKNSGADAIRYIDDFPEGAKTIVPLKDFNSKEATTGEEGRTTGLKMAVTGQERIDKGLQDLPPADRQKEAPKVQSALESINADPEKAPALVSRIVDGGDHKISSEDAAVLLVERNRVMNERDKWEAVNDNPESTDAEKTHAEGKLADIENQLDRLDRAQRLAGSEWGRTGHLYQRMINEDYSLARMETNRRKILGRPLNEGERAELKASAEKIADLQNRLQQSETSDKSNQEKAALSDVFQKQIESLKAEADRREKVQPMVSKVIERIGQRLDKEADSARARIKARLKEGRQMSGLDPADLADHAIIGAKYIKDGAEAFSEWSGKMLEDFGDRIKPYLQQIYQAAQDKINASIDELAGDHAKDLRARRKELSLMDATSRAKAEAAAGESLNHNTVQAIALSHIREGLHDEDAVIKATHEDVKKAYPDATERDVRRAYVDYGNAKFPSREQDLTTQRNLKSLVRLQESIDRLTEGLDALKTGPQRDKATQEIRDRQKQLNDLLKQRLGDDSPEKLATRDQAKQRALQNRIADLDKQLRTGEKVERSPGIPDSIETEQLRSERDAMAQKLKEIEEENNPKASPEERYNAMRQRAIAKQLAEVNERIATGNYEKAPKKEPPQANAETIRAYKELQEAKETAKQNEEKARLANRSAPQKLIDATIKTPWHFGTAITIAGHGTVGMVTHAGGLIYRPSVADIYWKNFARQFSMWAKPDYHARLIYNLVNDAQYDFWKDAGLSIDPHKTYTDYGLYAKWMGKLAEGGSRGFDALKLTRLELAKRAWDSVSPEIKANSEQSKAMAKLIAETQNKATGAVPRSNDPVTSLARHPLMNIALFAPKLYASRYIRTVVDPVKTAWTFANWSKSTAPEKAIAVTRLKNAAEFSAVFVGALITNQAILSATGSNQQVNLDDPTKSDWLKFKIGGKVVVADGGLLDPIRLIGKIVYGDFIKTQTKQERFRDGLPYEKAVKDMGEYVRGKFNPSLGIVTDVASQHDAQGRTVPWSSSPNKYKDQVKYTYPEYILSKGPIPIANAVKIVYEGMRKAGVEEAQAEDIIKGAALSFLGLAGEHIQSDFSLEHPKKEAHQN